MHQKLRLVAFIFVLLGRAESSETQINIALDSYSDPVSIHEFTRNWNGEYQGGHYAFLHGRTEISHKNNENEFALLWRYDYLIDFSEYAAEIYNAYMKELPPPLQKEYLVSLSAQHTSALGFRWSPQFNINDALNISTGLNVLKGKQLTEGSIEGITRFIGTGFTKDDFGDTAISINYHYDHPQLHEKDLDWHPVAPTGYGASLDLNIEYQPNYQSKLSLNLYDVWGRIYWRGVPTTQYDFSYKPKSYDFTGGLSINKSYIQKLPLRGKFTADFNIQGTWRTGFSLQANRYMWLGQLYGGYQFNNWFSKFLVEPQTQALGISIENQYIKLRWLADSLRTNQAHRLGLDLSLRLPFGRSE